MKTKAIVSVLVALGFVALAGWLCLGWPKLEQAVHAPPDAGSRDAASADPNQAAIAAAALSLQEQEVQSRIVSNLRRLAQGAEETFLTKGYSSVASNDLVGAMSSQFAPAFHAVANESYPAIIVSGRAITASDPTNRRTVTISF